MSGPAHSAQERDDPALDDGVLAAAPVLEFNGFAAVRRQGGCAILPWRGDHLAARRAGCAAEPDARTQAAESFAQVLVRLQKGRAATYGDLVAAWRMLRAGGALVVAGGNDLGIASWCKRLAAESGAAIDVLANHSRARAARMIRPASCPRRWLEEAQAAAAPGVFSGGRLDAGSALLIEVLAELPAPQRVLDLGCGAGALGFAALARWPAARALLLDADARAIAAVEAALQSDPAAAARAVVWWWDVDEALPDGGFDLILCNPPCHAGTANDLGVARAMFRRAAGGLAAGGRLLVVANRQLPYEADLAELGESAVIRQGGGFKLLEMRRR